MSVRDHAQILNRRGSTQMPGTTSKQKQKLPGAEREMAGRESETQGPGETKACGIQQRRRYRLHGSKLRGPASKRSLKGEGGRTACL
eukprot:3206999-Rhodomonas_salina.1